MILDILLWGLLTTSLTVNGLLIWYIRKLMSVQEEMATELVENINVFQDELEKLLDMDVLTGEPVLVKLLEDVRELGASTEDIKLRLIPNKEDGE